MNLLDLPQLNPAFKAWLEAQPKGAKDKILAHWEETANDPEFQHGGSLMGRLMGRAMVVVNRCMENHGFDPDKPIKRAKRKPRK